MESESYQEIIEKWTKWAVERTSLNPYGGVHEFFIRNAMREALLEIAKSQAPVNLNQLILECNENTETNLQSPT